jgi:hypothetical protein
MSSKTENKATSQKVKSKAKAIKIATEYVYAYVFNGGVLKQVVNILKQIFLIILKNIMVMILKVPFIKVPKH